MVIRFAEGELVHTLLVMFEEPPVTSEVHGIPVTTIASGTDDFMFFMVDFQIENIVYRIELSGTIANIPHITEIVNRIILNGAADLSVLENPEIPEIRDDSISLQEAINDLDFGAYIPVVPSGFNFESAGRFINVGVNQLYALWSSGLNTIFWVVAEPTREDLNRIVEPHEYEKYDMSRYSIPFFDTVPEELFDYVMNPVFYFEDLTLDIIKARVFESSRETNSTIQMEFSVLFGDSVIVWINASGVTPEQMWEMISQLG